MSDAREALEELKTLFSQCSSKCAEDAYQADSEKAESYHEGQRSAYYNAEAHVHEAIEQLTENKENSDT